MYDSLSLIYFVLYAFVFIFGCMIGSFLNVVVYRAAVFLYRAVRWAAGPAHGLAL